MNLRTCLLLAFASSAVAKFDFDFVKGTAADTDSTPDDTDSSFLPKWLVRLGPRPPVAAHHEQAACEPTYAPHHRTPGYRRRSRHEARAEHWRPCLVGLAAPGALWPSERPVRREAVPDEPAATAAAWGRFAIAASRPAGLSLIELA
jgi:hypothetical protein